MDSLVGQWCPEEFAKRSVVLLSHVPFRITESHGPKRGCLCCFTGLNFCPWCGKEGQNERTMVIHLWTMHYKLGLVCSKCLHFPSITSEAIQHLGWGCKQPRWSNTREEDGGQWHIHIRLPNPNHPLQPEHYLPRQQGCKHSKTITPQDTHTFSRIHTIFVVISTICYEHTYFCNKNNFKVLNSHLCSLPCAT